MSNWQDRALFQLVATHKFDGDAAKDAVSAAVALAEESGETPEAMYGTADEWAAEHTATVRDNLRHGGNDPFYSEPAPTWLTLLKHTLICVGIFSFLFWLSTRHMAPTVGTLVTPLIIGVSVAGINLLYERLERRMTAARAAGVAFATLVAVTALAGLVLAWARNVQIDLPVWWMPVQAAVLFVLGLLVPSRRTSEAPASTWEQRAAEEMRLRGDYSENEIRSALAEARAFASQSGSDVDAEFGEPRSFARSLPSRPAAAARRAFFTNLAWFAALSLMLGLSLTGHGKQGWWVTMGVVVWALSGLVTLVRGVDLVRTSRKAS